MGLLPMAHAITVFISYQLSKGKCVGTEYLTSERLQEAWTNQKTLSIILAKDVDRKCLELLEERMFERSAEAGIAGNKQWGLDAGDHQQHWDPYVALPDDWDHRDRCQDNDPKEFLVRDIYIVEVVNLEG